MQKVNYDDQMVKIIAKLNNKPKLLLHSCCAPCSTACITRVKDFFDLTVYYYNPNLDSKEEYEKRVKEQQKLCSEWGVKLVVEDYNSQEFLTAVKGLENEKEGGKRCAVCFNLRLKKACEYAKMHDFDYFTTTLTVSPLKNADLLNNIGKEIGEKAGVKFLPSDFKKNNGYALSVELSKQFNMYRQNYCGCIFSKQQRQRETEKKEYDYYFFDLDGTLTDPGIGITNSIIYALNKYNIKVEDRRELYKFIGPPLVDSFMKYYGFSKEQGTEALMFYREYFGTKGLFENTVYSGVESMLKELKDRGKKLVLTTSKPEEYSVKILKHFNLFEYFDFIGGATMDEKRNKKDEIIAYNLEQIQIKDKEKVLMIGDRKHDILGAKANGIDSVGVLYGYGSEQELKENGATYLVKDVKGILEI